ncbi:MAG: transglutaminase domain-containing protein, partial [Gemmatimonadota bacterium]
IHLARLEALGLGIKIDRADFGADAILAAIDRIVLDREGYRERGRPLAEALRSCPDGALVADLVDSHFARAGRAYSTDSAYLTPIEDFVRYLECSTPPELGRAAIEEMVARGLARGMPHVQREGRTFADQVDSWNWLNEHEPRFFEADYWAQEVKRSRFFTATGSGVRARGLVQHYRATYSLRFLSAEGAAGPEGRRRLKVFLPYPVTRPGQQTGVRLLSCTPTDMARNLVPAAGFFYGYVCTATSEGGAPAFEYTCEYTSRELARERLPGPAELPASEARRYLELDPAILRLPEFIQFRRSLDLPARATALHTARAIYDALCRTKRFRKTKDPTHNPLYCVAAVLGQEGAHCVTLARTYISLCRAAGIPAREVTGALMGYPMPDGAFERRGYCEPLFGHTWAEVHVPGEGWLPVEFHSLAIGAAALRPGNVSDRRLRRTIRDNTHPYDSYYFGNLDHQRIVCSGSIKRIPQILVESPLSASAEGRPWKPDDGLKYECRLRIELA